MSSPGVVFFLGGPFHGQITEVEDRTPTYYCTTWDGVSAMAYHDGIHVIQHQYHLYELPSDPWVYVHESMDLVPRSVEAAKREAD